MATDDPETPPPRRRARREPLQRGNGQVRSAAAAARIAVREITALTGRPPNNIVAIRRSEDGWCVEVELVETRRIPDSADILAVYQTELDGHGELMSYRRTRRYLRGKVSEE